MGQTGAPPRPTLEQYIYTPAITLRPERDLGAVRRKRGIIVVGRVVGQSNGRAAIHLLHPNVEVGSVGTVAAYATSRPSREIAALVVRPGSFVRRRNVPSGIPAAGCAERDPSRYAKAMAARATAAIAAHFIHPLRLGAAATTGDADSDPSAKARSAAHWKRGAGSFSRQRRTTWSRASGTEGGNAGGSSLRMAFIVNS